MKIDVTAHDMKLAIGSTLRYRMEMPNGDTMFALVDTTTGLLVIYEYDGTWGHWWNLKHIGKQTFIEFLKTSRSEYLADKLVPHDKQRCIDEEATIEAHKEAARRAGRSDDDLLMDEIESTDWEAVVAGGSNPLDEEGIEGEHWNLIEYQDSRWLTTVRDVCLPLLKRALSEYCIGGHEPHEGQEIEPTTGFCYDCIDSRDRGERSE